MDKQILILAAHMLSLAADIFSNHGCDDLTDETINLISDPDTLCNDIREWNNDSDGGKWPETPDYIGNASLMNYLSNKLKKESSRKIKVFDIETETIHDFIEFKKFEEKEGVTMHSKEYGYTSNSIDKVRLLHP